jgi:hypothetical protein
MSSGAPGIANGDELQERVNGFSEAEQYRLSCQKHNRLASFKTKIRRPDMAFCALPVRLEVISSPKPFRASILTFFRSYVKWKAE